LDNDGMRAFEAFILVQNDQPGPPSPDP